MAPTPVPKPADAGVGKTAIARTSAGFVNLRTGPSTDHEDIGDVLNNTQVVYYPNSQRADGWVWLEQYGGAGWVYTGVITFEDIDSSSLPNYPPTPYDGKIAVWHWKGQGLPENTIEQFASNLKYYAPNVSQVWVKAGDGPFWQGRYDSGDMAINGPADIDRWVQVLDRYGLEFHAWFVLEGEDINAEASLLIQTGQRPGVKSIILDIEPYENYWQAGPEPIRPLMTQVRRELGGEYHIGLSIDPRAHHYESIHPDEWFPFVDSVHPQTYWKSFRRPIGEVIEEVYRVWSGYRRPIIPALQGDAPPEEQFEATAMVTQRFGAKGVSWWRYGVISEWSAIDTPLVINTPPPTNPVEKPPPGTRFGEEVLIFPGEPGFRSGSYTGRNEFTKFQGAFGWDAYYTSTEPQTSKVWAEWKAELPVSGIYQISVFIPARHATTRRARYKVHAVRGTTTEVIVDLNQSIHRNEWVPLGVFDLVKDAPNAGKVFLNDVTGETDREIAFDAVRLRQLIRLDESDPVDIVDGIYVADGYDSPVGTDRERRETTLWPPGWRDASPFGELYFIGTVREAYHTGADLNWGSPTADLGLPVYATASGVVVFADRLRVWGNVIVIRHDPLYTPTGRVMYSRYGHVQDMIVRPGQRVKRGDQIAEIGNAYGTLVPHLHFDLSHTTRLETNPEDWPGRDANRLFSNYVDPLRFIRNNRPR